jgi:4-hydroxy-tetrahydrodipicolinate synthase
MKTKKKTVFRGTATALVTPFCNGEIDFTALARLIDIQIQSGITALVIGGTTGEAATLSDGERYDLYKFCAECIRGRAKMILGTGTNDTRAALRHTKLAESLKADAALLVTPYYNKGTEEGVFQHYSLIADECDLPLILYNVPSRTGVNLGLNLLARLAERENIVAIKEASDSVDRLVDLSRLSDSLTLYAGNDSQIYPTLALGGEGVISVASNVYPRTVNEISNLYFAGKTRESLEVQKSIIPLCKALFTETNPAPVKYAMARLGMISGELRLPLYEVRESTKVQIDTAIKDFKE